MGAGSIVNTNGDSNIGELDNMVSVTFFFLEKTQKKWDFGDHTDCLIMYLLLQLFIL
jgi:hypothetical protein